MNKKVLAEIKRAYGDSQQFPNTIEGRIKEQKAYKSRNLNFRAPESVNSREAAEIMKVALGCKSLSESGYNEFAPKFLLQLPKNARVTLAREGSVCVYVKLPPGEDFDHADADSMKADEYRVTDDGSIRLWWD
jgi:hypothetical protein